METVAMSGNDTIILDDQLLTDLADGDAVTLQFQGDIASVKTSKNGNSIYAFNNSGEVVSVTIRVIKGSRDDKRLNARLASMKANFAGFVLMNADFTKKIGDGTGKIARDNYIMSGGIFTKNVDAKTNAEGDVEQSVSVYQMKFSNAPRAIN